MTDQNPDGLLRRFAATVIFGILLGWNSGALGQANEVEFAGYRFDPLQLESPETGAWDELGVGRDLQAPDPPARQTDHWRLLQFLEIPDREARSELRSTYALTLDRFSGGVYLEKLSLDDVDELKRQYDLRASVPYQPAFKLAPSLRGPSLRSERTFETEARQRISGLLLRAELFAGADIDSTVEAIRNAGALDVYPMATAGRSPQRVIFRLDGDNSINENVLIVIAHIQDIRKIEEVGEFLNNNVKTASANQSGNRNNASIWNRNLTGSEQVIGIFDSGIVDTGHCFFEDPSIPGNVPGYDHRKLVAIRDQSKSYPDGLSHTTFVAGSAAGDDHASSGGHDQRGGAWSARLYVVNINDINEIVYTDDFGTSIVAPPPSSLEIELLAASEVAHVHANSWEQSLNGYSLLAEAFDRFSRVHEDNLFVASAGKDYREWSAPPIAKNVLTVSAVSADGLSTQDGYDELPASKRQKPDLAAVGCQVRSAISDASGCGVSEPLLCATSFAAPHAASIAALARQYFVQGYFQGRSQQPTGSLLKAVLINSARDVADDPGFPSQREGWGVITLDRTLEFPNSSHSLWLEDVRNSDDEALGNGDFREYKLTVGSGKQPLKVTLVWADSPSTDGSGVLVNNLDLVVFSPNGNQEFLGNQFDTTNGVSVKGGTADAVNNVEQVLLYDPTPGEWKIVVYAESIPVIEEALKGQGYALVATGDFSEQRAPKAPFMNEPGFY